MSPTDLETLSTCGYPLRSYVIVTWWGRFTALHPCRGPWHLRVSITHESKPERSHLSVGSTAADSYYSILLLTPLDAAARRKWAHINYVVVDEVTPRLASQPHWFKGLVICIPF